VGRLSESYLNDTPFDGSTIALQDIPRLTGQLAKVKAAMSDGCWHTLADLQIASGASGAGVSARIRDLRKFKFGGYQIDRIRADGGIWLYRMSNGANPHKNRSLIR